MDIMDEQGSVGCCWEFRRVQMSTGLKLWSRITYMIN